MGTDKKLEIIEAAQARFAQHGYNKVTMDEIATDLGISKASLYYYFADKDAVFKAVFEKEKTHFLAELSALLHKKMSAADRLKAYLKLRLKLTREYLTLAGFSASQPTDIKAPLRPLLADLMGKELSLVKSIVEAGAESEFRTDRLDEIPALLVNLFHGMRLRHRYFNVPLDEISREVMLLGEVLLNGINRRESNMNVEKNSP